jgi:NAD(P)H dehydrogenase (quinone)
MPLFAITGITGHVGGAAARRVLARGARVRGVFRKEGRATTAWRERGAEAAVAGLADADALRRAFDDADGVYVMTPTWFESADMFAENVRAVEALGQALRAARPGRVVLLSSIGGPVCGRNGRDPEASSPGAGAREPGRCGLSASQLVHGELRRLSSHVRATGVLPSVLAPLDRAHPMVATQDIGAVVADLLLDPARDGIAVELEGPRRYAPDDVAGAFGKLLGRPVKAQILPPSEWLGAYAEWGLTPRSAEAMSEMLVGFNSGHIVFEGSQAKTVHGPTTLEQVLADLVDRSSLSIPGLEISR